MEVFAMKQIQVMLTSIEEVKNFVSLTNKYPFPIQMTTEKYKIDAKSIMGVFSLDPVSYTHLDVYKRQSMCRASWSTL